MCMLQREFEYEPSISILEIEVFDVLLVVPSRATGEQIFKSSELRIILQRGIFEHGQWICMLRIVIFDILLAVPSLATGEQISKSAALPSATPLATVSVHLATGEFTNLLTEPKASVATGGSEMLLNKANMATGESIMSTMAQSKVLANASHNPCALIRAYGNCIGLIPLGGAAFLGDGCCCALRLRRLGLEARRARCLHVVVVRRHE